MTDLRCWWYGHMQHPQDSAPPEEATCMRCGEYVPYSDMVGDTRHGRTMAWLQRFRLPRRCGSCGARFGHRGDCDGLPF